MVRILSKAAHAATLTKFVPPQPHRTRHEARWTQQRSYYGVRAALRLEVEQDEGLGAN